MEAGLRLGGPVLVCHPPFFSSHRPEGRWGGDSCSLSSTRLHCLPPPVLALRIGSPAGSPSPAAQPMVGLPGVVLSILSHFLLSHSALPSLLPSGSCPVLLDSISGCLCESASLKRQTWKGPRRSSSPTLSFFRGGRQLRERKVLKGEVAQQVVAGPGSRRHTALGVRRLGFEDCVMTNLTDLSIQP